MRYIVTLLFGAFLGTLMGIGHDKAGWIADCIGIAIFILYFIRVFIAHAEK